MSTEKSLPDLGYPTKPHGRIPAFRDVQEEAEWWDTHDLGDYLDDFRPVEVSLNKGFSHGLTVRLDTATLTALRKHAAARGLKPTTLMRMWVKDQLRREAEATASR